MDAPIQVSPQPPARPWEGDQASGDLAALAELVAVVAQLRDPERGCPWDLQQTHSSLVPYLLEEAHELADAIRHGDDRQLAEELGDLLLQVVLHAQLARERGGFDLAQIAAGISAKLIRRHPHVFGADDDPARGDRGQTGSSEAVALRWQEIKALERQQLATSPPGHISDNQLAPEQASANQASANQSQETGGSASPLSDLLRAKVRGQPALAGAMAISRKAAAAGFEWDHIEGVWAKVHEELDELKEAVAELHQHSNQGQTSDAQFSDTQNSANQASQALIHAQIHAQEELGDVIFTLVNVGRWCGLDPEAGLAGTNQRFLQRFSRVEAALSGDLQGKSIRELEAHWQRAKAAIRAEKTAANTANQNP
jgi:XTP/dITP diphosphohydrolase